MKNPIRFFLTSLLLMILGCEFAWSWYPATQPGMPLPRAYVIDELDRVIDINEIFQAKEKKPVLLVPLFTRCHMSCPILVNSLEKASADFETGQEGRTFQVVLLSFDAGDTSADLNMFRKREKVPLAWKLVRAQNQNTIRQFFDQFSYSIMDSDGGFSHPSQIFVLNSNLNWEGSLLGPDLSVKDLSTAYDAALESENHGMVARIERVATNPESLLVLGAIGLCSGLVLILIMAFRQRRWS